VRRLGVNIDHIATLRNARGELHPDPIFAAKFVKKAGADSITIHLREDRRHIKDNDAKKICSLKNILVNLEISTNLKMISKALKIKPNYICLVPENRKEVTTEGGLNLNKNKNKIKNIKTSYKLGSDCVEIHTGRLSRLVKLKKNYSKELNRIKKCSIIAKKIGLEVHAGHGLDYKTTELLSRFKEIEEFNIGHYLIGESVFFGLSKVIKKFKKIIK
jgi:pyridoxine 5-phosphate synthase